MKYGIKEYFKFILTFIIIPVYIVILIMQKLEEILNETKPRIDHLEESKENKGKLLTHSGISILSTHNV